MTTVYVCPQRDIECGRNPANWCESCPQKKVDDATRDANRYTAMLNEDYHAARANGFCKDLSFDEYRMKRDAYYDHRISAL